MKPDFAPTRVGRIGVAGIAAAGVLACAVWHVDRAAHANEPPRPVPMLSFDNAGTRANFVRFRALARQMGIEQRHNVTIELAGVDITDSVALSGAVARALGRHPAALIAPNGDSLAAAMRQTTTVPIVFATHQDPVDLRLVESLVRRQANLAGISFSLPIEPKMLELLLEAAPGAHRIGFLADDDFAQEPAIREFLAASARERGIEWTIVRTTTLEALPRALHEAGPVDAWFATKATALDQRSREFVALVAATRRPAIYPSQRQVEDGAPMSYEAVFDDTYGAILRQLDRVLSGVPPASIPIERPKRFTLAVNPRAAHAAGMRVPAELLARADVVQ